MCSPYIILQSCGGPACGDLQVRYEFGVASNEKLESLGAKVELETYNGMGHSVSSSPWVTRPTRHKELASSSCTGRRACL